MCGEKVTHGQGNLLSAQLIDAFVTCVTIESKRLLKNHTQ